LTFLYSNGTFASHVQYQNKYLVVDTASHGPVVYGSRSSSDSGTLTATALWTGALIWSYNPHSSLSGWFTVYSLVPGYLLARNESLSSGGFQEFSLIVLSIATGNVKVNIGGMGGLATDGVPPRLVNGHDLIVVAGNTEREMTIDLDTGYITKQVPYTESSFAVKAHDIGVEIRVTKMLEIQVGPMAGGGPYTTAAHFTPSSGSFNLQYYSQGVIQVGNLQGWTLWQIKEQKTQQQQQQTQQGAATTTAAPSPAQMTAVLLDRDETSPGWTPSVTPTTLSDGTAIFVEGTSITGVKLVL
jgi:hypothetical protein